MTTSFFKVDTKLFLSLSGFLGFFRLAQAKKAKCPTSDAKSYFYSQDKIFKIWPEVYDNSDKNRRFLWKKILL